MAIIDGTTRLKNKHDDKDGGCSDEEYSNNIMCSQQEQRQRYNTDGRSAIITSVASHHAHHRPQTTTTKITDDEDDDQVVNSDDVEDEHNMTKTTENWKEEYQILLQKSQKSIGNLHCRTQLRQLGGLMFVLGIGSAFSTKALIGQLIVGQTGNEQIEGFLLPILVGNILQLGCGLTSMGCGFVALLLGPYPSHKFHTACKITTFIINLGPIAFLITLIRIIQGASSSPPEEINDWIPISFEPTQGDIRFCSAIAALVLISVCCTLIGGLTVLGLHMCAILGRQPHSRHKSYHYIRLVYYNLLVLLGGLSQFMLGIYLSVRYGVGPYDEPIHLPAYTVHFPIVSIIVGITQMMMGYMGIYWKRKSRFNNKDDHSFMYIVGITWIVTTILQFVFQPSYGSQPEYNSEGATVAAVYLGFFVMPAYLDYLVRTTPTQPQPGYYGLDTDAFYKEDFLTKLFNMEPCCCAATTKSNSHDINKNQCSTCGCKKATTTNSIIAGGGRTKTIISANNDDADDNVQVVAITSKPSTSSFLSLSSIGDGDGDGDGYDNKKNSKGNEINSIKSGCRMAEDPPPPTTTTTTNTPPPTTTQSSDLADMSMSNVSTTSLSLFFDELKPATS